jgi:hypothetical protein
MEFKDHHRDKKINITDHTVGQITYSRPQNKYFNIPINALISSAISFLESWNQHLYKLLIPSTNTTIFIIHMYMNTTCFNS